MESYSQDTRHLRITTPLGKDVLLLQSIEGEEAVSRPFHFELTCCSREYAVPFDAVVGKRVTVEIVQYDKPDKPRRIFNGFVSGFSQAGSSPTFAWYHATLVPWTWFLTRTADCRIFQHLTVPDIIRQVFTEAGFNDFRFALQGTFQPREYCVQYRETDFNFVSRLMEEEGIFYFFEHDPEKHILVMANHNSEFRPCPDQPEIGYEWSGGGPREERITEFAFAHEVRPGRYTLRDYNFEHPSLDLTATAEGRDPRKYEIYDYPGEYLTRDEGERYVSIRMSESETPLVTAVGSGSAKGFIAGYRFTLRNHYRSDFNTRYVLTSVRHRAEEGTNYRSTDKNSSTDFEYANTFTCIPFATPYRPPRVTPIPTVRGTQTAFVVGPPGEEIFTDQYGRVKVQFHWDREGKRNEHSSCWIRVGTNWAGKMWGAISLPRIGHEVIVDFLEGDPDKPLIVGSVYNAEPMPPYALPEHKTRMTTKSRSTLGGGPDNFNEIRFEDKKGAEQIFINAEKDLDLRVELDSREFVGRERHTIVLADRREAVRGDQHLQVEGDFHQRIGPLYALEVGNEIHVKAGSTVVIEAPRISLVGAGGFIDISERGVTIQGVMVYINSGGDHAVGSGAAPVSPDVADDGSRGTKLT